MGMVVWVVPIDAVVLPLTKKKLREAGMKLRDHLRNRLSDLGLQRMTRTWNVDYCHHTQDTS